MIKTKNIELIILLIYSVNKLEDLSEYNNLTSKISLSKNYD